MGNEMGNRNITGLQDKDNTTVEAPEKSLQESVKRDDVKGENQRVTLDQGKDFHEKVTGLASDDPSRAGDPHIDNQTLDGKEEDETEVQTPVGSPEVPAESNDAGGEASAIQPAASSKDADDHDDPIESNLEWNMSGTSDHQIQKQDTIRKDDEETRYSTSDTISISHDPETLESVDPKFDQQELVKLHADPSIEDPSCESPRGSEEILGSSLSCDCEEKDHLLDTEIAESLAGSIVSDDNPNIEKERNDLLVKEMASPEEKTLGTSICEEKFESIDEDEVGNGLSKITTITSNFQSGFGEKCDGGLPTEMNLLKKDPSDSQEEAIPQANSLNSFQEELPKPEDKCMVLTEETKLVGSGSENEVNQHDPIPAQFCDESMKESMIDEVNASQSQIMTIGSERESNGKESLVESPHNLGINKDCQIGEAKVTENGYQVNLSDDNQLNSVSEKHCKDSEEVTEMVPEIGTVLPTELTVTDFNHEGEEPTEKKIVEEIEEKTETTEQCLSQTLPTEQAQGLLSPSPACPVQSQACKQDTVIVSEVVENENVSKQEIIVTNTSTFDSTNSTEESVVSALELENEKPGHDLPEDINTNSMTVKETEASANQSNEQCAKGETSVIAGDGNYEAQESDGRFSTESNPDNLCIHGETRKSPSFDFDLSLESTTGESDQTPLLYQDKTATATTPSRVGVSIGNPIAKTEYGQDPLQYQAMSVEEKTIKFERSDSEKLRTPFLSFLKEEEEAHVVVTPHKQDSLIAERKAEKESWNSPTKEVASTLPKGREKRRSRSSLFTNCMCCAAVIN